MSTNTIASNMALVERLREENAGILERVREHAVENKPAEVDLLHGIGRVLDAFDSAMREAIAGHAPVPAPGDEGIVDDAPMRILADLVADRTAAGIDESSEDDPLALLVRRARAALALNGIARIPSADELFATRGIIVTRLYYPGCPSGWVALLPRNKSTSDLGLGSDGWVEWHRDTDPMYFTTELEARAAAAATPLPDEQPALPAPRFAVILVHDGTLPSDHDLDGVLEPEGVTIAAAFDPDPGDLGSCQGAHRVALDMIRSAGAGGVAAQLASSEGSAA